MKAQMKFEFVKGEPIAAINRKTVYDVPEKLRALARTIENGEYGVVTDAIVALRYDQKRDGERSFTGFHYGTGNGDTCIAMMERIKLRVVGLL